MVDKITYILALAPPLAAGTRPAGAYTPRFAGTPWLICLALLGLPGLYPKWRALLGALRKTLSHLDVVWTKMWFGPRCGSWFVNPSGKAKEVD